MVLAIRPHQLRAWKKLYVTHISYQREVGKGKLTAVASFEKLTF